MKILQGALEYNLARVPMVIYTECLLYSMVQKISCMFEFPAFLPPTNLGLPMHSPSALTEHVSLNLARFFLLNPVLFSAI